MLADPIVLPPTPPEPRRPSLPFLAAVVPIAAGTVLWLVTGSLLALCFAFLGPLMIFGSIIDGLRQRRKERRRTAEETDAAWRRTEAEIAERREHEREVLWSRHPDMRRCAETEPLREENLSAATALVVGRGERPSELRLSGGDGERAREARRRTSMLTDAPVVVRIGRGVCVRSTPVVADAVVRALVAQLTLRFPPGRLTLGGDLGIEERFPHAGTGTRAAFRVAIARDGASPPTEADAVFWALRPGAPVPDGVTTVIDGVDPGEMTVRTPDGVQPAVVECVSSAQVASLALTTAHRAPAENRIPDRVLFSALDQPEGALTAAIGCGLDGDLIVDLIADGPHAMVTGMTGVGKSELLVSWVVALAGSRSPEEVLFVLADFKGGTAFDSLRTLPHVTAVLTDLDDEGADRGVRSLTAELRRRERVLAAAGARDIADPAVRMPRLVIVIDEFAALLQEHPDLAAVFTDIAARGRALGMHLVLGTQRANGVIREALAANCPLRISLRVSDPADSRLVIGTEAAAELEGGTQARGIAFVRRPQDDQPRAARVALTSEGDVRTIAARWATAERGRSPWLPALASRIPLAELPEAPGVLRIGLADAPERQSQPLVHLRVGRDRGFAVIGGPGAGKSGIIRLLRTQHPDAIVIPSDGEAAWDAVAEPTFGAERLVLCDDVDRIVASLPGEYALVFAERFELALRGSSTTTAVLTAGRATGALSRILDAVPERMLLQLPSRSDHLAAGGESAEYRPDRPPGRGRLARQEVQVAWVEPGGAAAVPPVPVWAPGAGPVAVIGQGGTRLLDAMRAALPGHEVLPLTGATVPMTEPVTERAVMVGDPDEWQRDWGALQRARSAGEVLVLAEQPAALRTLLGIRELPPYARPHAGRAWLVRDGATPVRVRLSK